MKKYYKTTIITNYYSCYKEEYTLGIASEKCKIEDVISFIEEWISQNKKTVSNNFIKANIEGIEYHTTYTIPEECSENFFNKCYFRAYITPTFKNPKLKTIKLK